MFAVGMNDHLAEEMEETKCMDGSSAKPGTGSSSVAVVNCSICLRVTLPLLPPAASAILGKSCVD